MFTFTFNGFMLFSKCFQYTYFIVTYVNTYLCVFETNVQRKFYKTKQDMYCENFL